MKKKGRVDVPATTAVYLITGFLGSGKTTFLNRMVNAFPRDRKLMILMNEFGDVGVDGQLIVADDVDMLEISKGSIFCVCVKTDFIRGLMDIAQRLQPDVLIIEATGVANPADLKRDLKLSIFNERFQFKEQFCMIDAKHFEDVYATFTSVEKQIESSTVFVINKVDLVDDGTVETIKSIVATHHAAPRFYESVHADIPLKPYVSEAVLSDRVPASDHQPISSKELDTVIDRLIAAPDTSMTPPDPLRSAVYVWSGADRSKLDAIGTMIPDGIARAKGVVKAGSRTLLFSYVMGRGEVMEIGPRTGTTDRMNLIVFIGSPQAIEAMACIDFNGMLRRCDPTLMRL